MGPVRGNGHRGLVSEINVTPLVDVMLVLLIIFMITAPMMTQGLNVDLPQTTDSDLQGTSVWDLDDKPIPDHRFLGGDLSLDDVHTGLSKSSRKVFE